MTSLIHKSEHAGRRKGIRSHRQMLQHSVFRLRRCLGDNTARRRKFGSYLYGTCHDFAIRQRYEVPATLVAMLASKLGQLAFNEAMTRLLSDWLDWAFGHCGYSVKKVYRKIGRDGGVTGMMLGYF